MNSINLKESKNLNAELLAHAEKAVSGKGDGRISAQDADELIAIYQKNPDELGIQTLRHIMVNNKLTDAAVKPLKKIIRSVLPIPADCDYRFVTQAKVGVCAIDEKIYYSFSGIDGNYYCAAWNPITSPHKGGGGTNIGNHSGKDRGVANVVLEGGIVYTVLPDTFTNQLKYTTFQNGKVLNKYGAITLENGEVVSSKQTPSLTAIGNAIYLSWVDEKTECICMAQMDAASQDYGSFKSLFTSVNQNGYEKTSFGVGIIPIAIAKEVGGKLVSRQKIMIVWAAKDSGNQIYSVFYDVASGAFSGFINGSYIANSDIAIERLKNDTIIIASGGQNSLYFQAATFELNENRTAGSWSNHDPIYTNNDEAPIYAPTFLQFAGDVYLFYLIKSSVYMSYVLVDGPQ